MTTVEEHIEALRNTGERMPRSFIRSGLLYELYELDEHHNELGPYYLYEPCEPFEVDGILYRPWGHSSRLMLHSLSIYQGSAGGGVRMNHANPPTDDELDRWVRTPDSSPYLYDPDQNPF